MSNGGDVYSTVKKRMSVFTGKAQPLALTRKGSLLNTLSW